MIERSIKNSTMRKIKVINSSIISLLLMFTSVFNFGNPAKAYAATGFFLEAYYSQDSVTAGEEKPIALVVSDRYFSGIKTLSITGYETTLAGAATVTYFKDDKGGKATVDLDASGTTTVQAYFASNSYSRSSGTTISIKLNKAGCSKVTYSVNGAYADTSYAVNPAPANLSRTGYTFISWEDETGSIIRYCNPYNFVITRNKTLTAIFSDTPVNRVPNVSLDDDVIELNVNYSSGKMYFISTISVPPPYQLVECGVVVSKTTNTDLTKANADATLVSTAQNEVGQYYSIFNVPYGKTLYARSYVTYKDANGTLVTKYSINCVAATQNIQ